MVDTRDLKSLDSNVVRVRVPPGAQSPPLSRTKKCGAFFGTRKGSPVFSKGIALRKWETRTDPVGIESVII